MLTHVTKSLIAVARDQTATDADINAAAQSFFTSLRSSSRDDANNAMRDLSAHFDMENASRAAFLALVCGSLVERGCDPLAIAGPLTKRLASLLEAAAAMAKACHARLPRGDGEEQDTHEVFERVRSEIAPTMPAEDAAWAALGQFWRPAIAVFSASADARAAARALREPAGILADHHEAGHWLHLMLSVLDQEPVVAIEPATSRGILGRISGIVDNFQLNTLLMDVFPRSGLFSRRRVSRRVADVARGKGPQQTNDTVTSVWNLHTWQAVQPDLSLPDPNDYASNTFWIWNEGTPEDIPMFEGRRAILLGAPSYPRWWRSQRMFDNLHADLTCDQTLTNDEAKGWLRRMLSARTSS